MTKEVSARIMPPRDYLALLAAAFTAAPEEIDEAIYDVLCDECERFGIEPQDIIDAEIAKGRVRIAGCTDPTMFVPGSDAFAAADIAQMGDDERRDRITKRNPSQAQKDKALARQRFVDAGKPIPEWLR